MPVDVPVRIAGLRFKASELSNAPNTSVLTRAFHGLDIVVVTGQTSQSYANCTVNNMTGYFDPDRTLSRKTRITILVLATLIPLAYTAGHYNTKTGFTSLIYFGQAFMPNALLQVRELKPAALSHDGYDGQFYAQIAVNPLLDNPQMARALDAPAFRSHRIFMPILAHAIGLGKPAFILTTYALLNSAFWILLLYGMVRYLHASSARDHFCILASVFTTGAMMSLQRALTDLPAATLGFYGTALDGAAASGAFLLAILTRETSVFYLLKFAWPLPKNRAGFFRTAFRCIALVAPLALWLAYIKYRFGSSAENTHPFVWPMQGWIAYIAMTWRALIHQPFDLHLLKPRVWEWRLFDFLSAFSLLFQAGSFAFRRNPESPYWRMGVGFAVMTLFLSTHILEEQIAPTRILLPMTIAFNIGLMPLRGSRFAVHFFAGNFGLLWGLRDTFGYCL